MSSSKKTYSRGDELLKKFISGSISSLEENELNSLAEEDPFLQDALDGYKMEPNTDHSRVVNEIIESKNQSANLQRKILKYAASLVLLISAGIWLFAYLAPETSDSNKQQIVESTSADNSKESYAMNNDGNESELSKEQEEQLNLTSSSPVPDEPFTKSLETKKEKIGGAVTKSQEPLQTITIESDKEVAADFSEQNSLPKTQQGSEELAHAKQRIPFDTLEKSELDDLVNILNESEDVVKTADLSDALETKDDVYNITGKVLDMDGEVLIGATLFLQGTEFGSTTDLNGNFELNLPTQDGTLEIHYLGYESLFIPVSKVNSQSKIILNPSDVLLDEVVVTSVGASSRKERNKANSNGSINNSEQILGYPSGGFSKFEKYLEDNKVYPKSEKEDDNHGEVEVQFIIRENGQLDSLEIVQSLGYILDNEAIRLFKEGPKWRTKPKRKEVKMKYRIRF